jgi:large subunit ribosomal protein L18
MHKALEKRNKRRKARTFRVRKRLKGSAPAPRLCVVKSNKHIEIQAIDDVSGTTIVGMGTRQKEFSNSELNGKSRQAGRKLGEAMAKALKEKSIERVIFDRGRFRYHGILAEIADGIREGGIRV